MALAVAVEVTPLYYSAVVEAPVATAGSVVFFPLFNPPLLQRHLP